VIRQCANPECDTEFLYADEGQLFPYEIRNPKEPCKDVPAVICKKKPGRAVVYFWLCAQCCQRFTLRFTMSSGVRLVSKRSEFDGRRNQKSLIDVASKIATAGQRYA
jgi:hypothetical protein